MTALLESYLLAATVVVIYMTLWFALALVLRRNDVADIAWGLGFVVLAWTYAIRTEEAARSVLLAALATVWGLRLAAHLWRRNRGRSEDFRYAAWRRQWGRWFVVRTYLQVFLLQGAFMVLVASPIVVVGADPGGPVGWLDAIGTGIALVGLAIEVAADEQLRRHRADASQSGRLLQTGLWGYSRHPNYFGEAVFWLGAAVVALSSPFGVVGLLGPLTITVLLVWVSGIPMLERHHAGEPEFEAYRSRVSAFVPLPPKTDDGGAQG